VNLILEKEQKEQFLVNMQQQGVEQQHFDHSITLKKNYQKLYFDCMIKPLNFRSKNHAIMRY